MEVNNLCCGCLIASSKMVAVNEFGKKQCFLQIINEIPMTPPVMVWLCWECDALVGRFSKFKEQVKHCYQVLKNYTEQNLNTYELQRPPRLRICKAIGISFPIEIEAKVDISDVKEEKEPSDIEIKEEDNNSTYSDNLDDDRVLIEFKSKGKKKKIKDRKKKKKKKDVEITKEIELKPEELAEERRLLAGREEYVNAMFRCERCILSFPNADDLNDHIKLKHDANKSSYTCKICECTFATEVSYNYHANKHTRRYQCSVCSERFSSRRAATKHYEITHCHGTELEHNLNEGLQENGQAEETQESNDGNTKLEMAQFPCEFCNKTFRWKTSLRKHVETHRIETGQKRKPYCEPCRLSFTTTSNLQKHVKTSSKHQIQLKLRKLKESLPEDVNPDTQAHIEQIKCSVNSSRQKFPCPMCDKRFQWRGNLLRHLHSHRARANGELVCEPCNRTFSSIATYNQHMKISKKHVSENDFKYMCSECGKKFANKTRLKDHVDWEHLKNFVHTCNLCQKVFKSHTSLYLHKQVVHKKDNAEHLCDHCGKHFPNHAKLRSHIVALHSASAPYKCSVCLARFSWHSCLSRHSRRVHREKDAPQLKAE